MRPYIMTKSSLDMVPVFIQCCMPSFSCAREPSDMDGVNLEFRRPRPACLSSLKPVSDIASFQSFHALCAGRATRLPAPLTSRA